MRAKQLVTNSLPFLNPEDTGEQALKLMDEFKVSHLPVVDGGYYITLLSEEDIYEKNLEDKKLSQVKLDLFKPYVTVEQTIFEILALLAKFKVSVLPVIDKNQIYVGSIIVNDLLYKLIDYFGLDQEGAILVFKIRQNDYSIVEIGQIVEANNAKILSFFLVPEENDKLRLIIKLNTKDVVSLMQTFERYDYEVQNVLFDDQKYKEIYQERLDALLSFLSI